MNTKKTTSMLLAAALMFSASAVGISHAKPTNALISPPPVTIVESAGLSDIAGSWCENYVTDLVSKGIVNGYPDGTYKASEPVSRGAISKMVFLSMKVAGSDMKESTQGDPFQDLSGHWAEKFITPLTKAGIYSTSENGKDFNPNKPMSRLDTAKTLVRVYLDVHPNEKLNQKAKLSFKDSGFIAAKDAPYIAFAVEKGIINGYDDNTFRPGNNINRGTAAAMISRFLQKLGTIQDTPNTTPNNNGGGEGQRNDLETPNQNVPVDPLANVEWAVKPSIKLVGQDNVLEPFVPVSDNGVTFYMDKITGRQTFLDSHGKICTYDGILVRNMLPYTFIGGMAIATDFKTQKDGVIDTAGNWIVQPKYDKLVDIENIHFKDGHSAYYVSIYDGSSYTMLNLDTMEIDKDYSPDKVDFSKNPNPNIRYRKKPSGKKIKAATNGGLFVYSEMLGSGVMRQPYYGICDQNGKVIVKPTAQTDSYGADPIHGAYYGAAVYNDYILLTHMADISFNTTTDVYDGMTGKLIYTFGNTPEVSKHYGIDCRQVGPATYGDGLFVASDKYSEGQVPLGYMDAHGNMVIPAVFTRATPFANGYAMVEYNGLWGMIKLPKF